MQSVLRRSCLQARCSLASPGPLGGQHRPRPASRQGKGSFHSLGWNSKPMQPRHSLRGDHMVAGAGGGSSGGGGHGGGGGGGGSGGGGGEGPMLPLNFHGVTIALLEAKASWDKNDKDRSGKLSLNEAIALLQSKELLSAARRVTGLDLPPPSKKTVEQLFKAADRDHSGDLSQIEFLALFLASATHTVKTNPMVLADALMGIIDKDRNGKLDGRELKSVLGIVGIPPVLLLAIPDDVGVEYRGIMQAIGSAMSAGR